jgi:ABC-type lipoprotein export system ATPase subunit
MRISVESAIHESPRVQQVRGLFDLSQEKTSRVEWSVDVPLHARTWGIGLITGPSGCGKSTIARHLFTSSESTWPEDLPPWQQGQSILDSFPDTLSIKDITALLSSVGFSSPPAWLRPFHVLSTGQQFRVSIARLLAVGMRKPTTLVCDEYTSVVDRTVAQVGSAAISRTVRNNNLQFVAVTCHEDVEAWLQPDWIYRPAENLFTWRCLQRRPQVTLQLVRCQASAWELFRPHHYLSHTLVKSAWCFLATWQDRPVCFSAWLPFMGAGPKSRREHRTVTLPDYQGIGIGNLVSDTLASMWTGLGYVARSTTTHPAMINSRVRSKNWQMTRSPALMDTHDDAFKHATTRMTAGFRYVGPAMKERVARLLLGK